MSMWDWVQQPGVLAAIVAPIAGGIGGMFSYWTSRGLKKEETENQNLTVRNANLRLQLDGWKEIADNLQEQIEDLNKRLQVCEADRQRLWTELYNRNPRKE